MQKIEKFLRKLSVEERVATERIIALILSKQFTSLNIKKLQGEFNTYRARKGRVRIIFYISDEAPTILDVQFRDDQTYR